MIFITEMAQIFAWISSFPEIGEIFPGETDTLKFAGETDTLKRTVHLRQWNARDHRQTANSTQKP